MSISIEHIEEIAKLARIRFDSVELAELCQKFDDILDYMEVISDAQLGNSESDAIYQSAPLRPDDRRDSMPIEDVLSNAPFTDRNMFRVPRVIDN